MLFSGADWIRELFIGVIGGLIGATLGAFLRAYWAKKGEHIASYEDIQFLLAKERGQAYEQEMGKRLATHEDVDNVRSDLRTLTLETETIKAQIGSDLWLRQTVWNHKRETYANVLKCSHALQNSINMLRSASMILIQAEKDGKLCFLSGLI